jgi:hypothetical protein
MSDALKTPASRWRKPPKPAREVVAFAHPKPAPRPRKDPKPMARGAGIQRKTWMKQRRGERRGDPNPAPLAFAKPAGRAYDDDYRAAVLAEPCLMLDVPGHQCDTRTTGDHPSSGARGRKADDKFMVPFCWSIHKQRQWATGIFEGVGKYAMRMIMTTAAAETQARVAMRRAAA